MAKRALLSASEQRALGSFVVRHWVSLIAIVLGTIGVIVLAGMWGIGLTFRGVLLLALLLWLTRHLMGIAWWLTARRRLLAKASLPAPPLPAMLASWRLERQRIRYVTKQWQAVCQVNNIVGLGKTVPRLNKMRGTIEGDLTCLVSPGPLGVKGGVDKISSAAPSIAETCGCPGGLLVKRTGVGHAVLTFMWTEPFERVLPISDLPKAAADRIAYGVNLEGQVMSIIMSLSVLVIGLTGSGKSGLLHALTVDLLRKVNHVLYFSDPKGGQELGMYKPLVGKTHGRRTVADWVGTADTTDRILDKMERALKERQAQLIGVRKWTPDMDDEYPLIVGVIDEALEVIDKLKPASKSKLMTILSQGRAAGVMLVLLCQLPQKEILGQMRGLIAQRLGLATENAIDTGLIFGDTQAEEKGARCSQLTTPGLGFARIEGERGYQPFRAALVTDDDIDQILRGELPAGMDDSMKVPVSRQCAVYLFFTPIMQSAYIGLSVDPGRRRDEHAGLAGKPQKWWWQHVDESKTVIMWCDSEAAARVLEEQMIRKYQPFGNTQHNLQNPMAGVEPVSLPKPVVVRRRMWGRAKPVPAPAPVPASELVLSEPAEPTNVTQMRRRPPTASKPKTTTRRRSA